MNPANDPKYRERVYEIVRQIPSGQVMTYGQIGYTMHAGDSIRIRKSRTTFNLVQPPNRNYFDVLRNKLKWGR